MMATPVLCCLLSSEPSVQGRLLHHWLQEQYEGRWLLHWSSVAHGELLLRAGGFGAVHPGSYALGNTRPQQSAGQVR